MIVWLRAHKLLIAAISVIGSLAGLGFSVVDLNSELKKKRLKR